MTNLPQVPKLPYISGKTLFEDDEKAKEWFEILQKRKAVLCKLVRNTTASMYARNELTENEELEEFVIVSPCTDGVHKYQLTKFDKYGMLDFEGMPETVGGRFRLPEGSKCE